MTNFKDLNLQTKTETTLVKLNDTIEVPVRKYLPTIEKAALLEYVVNRAIDQETGRFSPVRVDLFFSLAVAHWYADILFDDDVQALDAYDALQTNGVFDAIIGAIPQDEFEFISEIVNATVKDVADYNSSFAGVVQMASKNADGLDGQLSEIMKKIKDKDGLETLAEIKNMVGTD